MRIQLLAVCVLALGCGGFGPGSQDFTAALPSGYFIYRNSSHEIFVAPAVWYDHTPMIPAKVVELDHDERFVIAKQQLLELRSPNNPNDTYEQPKPGAYQYWILDLQVPKAYGPLSFDEFEVQQKKLGISTSLKLLDVYDYRP